MLPINCHIDFFRRLSDFFFHLSITRVLFLLALNATNVFSSFFIFPLPYRSHLMRRSGHIYIYIYIYIYMCVCVCVCVCYVTQHPIQWFSLAALSTHHAVSCVFSDVRKNVVYSFIIYREMSIVNKRLLT